MTQSEFLTVSTVLLIAFILSWVYVAILHKWDYSPRYTHVTVIIGNALIGFTILAFVLLGILPWLAFWLLLYTNIAWGLPVIFWYGRKIAQDEEVAQSYPVNGGAVQQREA
jgi:hypothetical protein